MSLDIMPFITSIFGLISKLVYLLCGVLAVILLPLFVSMGIFTMKKKIKGFKRQKFLGRKINRGSKLKRLYVDFPKQLVDDNFNKNPNDLDVNGVHLICGEQGSGKSMCAVEMLLRFKERYPFVKVRSNIDLSFQDSQIEDWKQLVFDNNGTAGQIEFIDEIQTWFNSNESKDFPPDMLQEISQQRKQRKMIVGTSQCYTRVAKPIREQVNLFYLPFTVAGAMTFVRVYKLQFNDSGAVVKKQLRNFYFFVHSKELREAYNTFEKVKRISLKGFQERSNQIGSKELFPIFGNSADK